MVSRVKLQLKIKNSDYPPGNYDAGRHQDESWRETLQERLNAELRIENLTIWKMDGIILGR